MHLTSPNVARGSAHRRLRVSAALLAVLGAAAGLFALSSCEMSTRFAGAGYTKGKGVTLPGVGDTVVVGVTHAVLDPDNRRAFDEHTRRVVRSLPELDGYIGHSLRTRVLGHEVWTMTVWKDDASLNAFVRASTHRTAIREGLSGVRQAQFLRMEIPVDQVPPTWDDILERLKGVPVVDYAARAASAAPRPASPPEARP